MLILTFQCSFGTIYLTKIENLLLKMQKKMLKNKLSSTMGPINSNKNKLKVEMSRKFQFIPNAHLERERKSVTFPNCHHLRLLTLFIIIIFLTLRSCQSIYVCVQFHSIYMYFFYSFFLEKCYVHNIFTTIIGGKLLLA